MYISIVATSCSSEAGWRGSLLSWCVNCGVLKVLSYVFSVGVVFVKASWQFELYATVAHIQRSLRSRERPFQHTCMCTLSTCLADRYL